MRNILLFRKIKFKKFLKRRYPVVQFPAPLKELVTLGTVDIGVRMRASKGRSCSFKIILLTLLPDCRNHGAKMLD